MPVRRSRRSVVAIVCSLLAVTALIVDIVAIGPFGLGGATSAQVRVVWPDGQTGPWMQVQADQFVLIDKDASSPSPWSPAKP